MFMRLLEALLNENAVELGDLLKNSDVDLNFKYAEYSGNTLLHLAIINEHSDLIHLIVEKSESVNQTNGLGKTPLHYAVSYRNLEAVKLLVEGGADLNIKDVFGCSALFYAVAKDIFRQVASYDYIRAEIAKLLLSGIKLDHEENQSITIESILDILRSNELACNYVRACAKVGILN